MKTQAQKIIPSLWFDDRALEAAELYTSLFDDARIDSITHYTSAGEDIHGRPQDTVMAVSFRLAGLEFGAINGGPHFTFTPAISFAVSCQTEEEVDRLWNELSTDGTVMMELDTYDWNDKYGWLSDRYGLSWQISLAEDVRAGEKIVPSFLFVGDQNGRAEEAMTLYTAAFDESAIGALHRYGPEHEHPDAVMHAQFSLHRQPFTAMDGGLDHAFTFNEAVSLQVRCRSQGEIDYYWERLGEEGDPNAQQCGWLKDKFGVSWQVTPARLFEMLQDPDKKKVERVTNAFLQMKKFDVGALETAYAEG